MTRRRGPRRPCRGTRAHAHWRFDSRIRMLARLLVPSGSTVVPPERLARALPAVSQSTRHGSSSMFARESDAVSPRLGGRTFLVCAAGTRSRLRVTRCASCDVRPYVVAIGGAHTCALCVSQCVVGQPRLVRLGVAWHSSSSSSSSSGLGSRQRQLLRGVHRRESRGSRSRLRRELARGTRRRSVAATVTAAAAAAAATRVARTR